MNTRCLAFESLAGRRPGKCASHTERQVPLDTLKTNIRVCTLVHWLHGLITTSLLCKGLSSRLQPRVLARGPRSTTLASLRVILLGPALPIGSDRLAPTLWLSKLVRAKRVSVGANVVISSVNSNELAQS